MSSVDSLFSKKFKLTNGEGVEFPTGRWPMPVKGTRIQITVNGVPTEAMKTETRDILYTYFVYLNNSMIVKGHLDDGSEYTLEHPEGFARETPPEPRKTYYKPKEPDYEFELNEDGTFKTGEDGLKIHVLDAEGNKVIKPKPVKATKAPKAKKEKAVAPEGFDTAAPEATPEPAVEAAPPPRRRREAPSQPAA